MSAPKTETEPQGGESAEGTPPGANGAAHRSRARVEAAGETAAFNRISTGDARELLASLPDACVDLSFWSPPYWVGKAYETHLTFEDWKRLLAEVIRAHRRVVKPGAFLAVNIGDILCFPGRFDAAHPGRQRARQEGGGHPGGRAGGPSAASGCQPA